MANMRRLANLRAFFVIACLLAPWVPVNAGVITGNVYYANGTALAGTDKLRITVTYEDGSYAGPAQGFTAPASGGPASYQFTLTPAPGTKKAVTIQFWHTSGSSTRTLTGISSTTKAQNIDIYLEDVSREEACEPQPTYSQPAPRRLFFRGRR